MIDEAYNPFARKTFMTRLAEFPNLVVMRTLSKLGLAGIRLGYAVGHAETIKFIDRYTMPYNANNMAVAAAIASLNDPAHLEEEKKRNTAARKFTVDWFEKGGHKPTDSQANFIFVNIGRPSKGFREQCQELGVLVGRDFPPMEKTHARISIGTMAEMQKAIEVFGRVLGSAPTTAGA